MFKWLRDLRYHDVQAELKILKAEIEAMRVCWDTLQTNMNSLRGLVNRKVRKSGRVHDDEDDFDDLTPAERAFIATLPPHELARIGKGSGSERNKNFENDGE